VTALRSDRGAALGARVRFYQKEGLSLLATGRKGPGMMARGIAGKAWSLKFSGMSAAEKTALSNLSRGELEALAERLMAENTALKHDDRPLRAVYHGAGSHRGLLAAVGAFVRPGRWFPTPAPGSGRTSARPSRPAIWLASDRERRLPRRATPPTLR
jgi:hypothetical protein